MSHQDIARFIDAALVALDRETALRGAQTDAIRELGSAVLALLAERAPPPVAIVAPVAPRPAGDLLAPAYPPPPAGRGLPLSLHLKLEPGLSRALEQYARARHCTKQAVVTHALRGFLDARLGRTEAPAGADAGAVAEAGPVDERASFPHAPPPGGRDLAGSMHLKFDPELSRDLIAYAQATRHTKQDIVERALCTFLRTQRAH